jgi:methionyl aminopeptidase
MTYIETSTGAAAAAINPPKQAAASGLFQSVPDGQNEDDDDDDGGEDGLDVKPPGQATEGRLIFNSHHCRTDSRRPEEKKET